MTPMTSDVDGEKAQTILVWVMAHGIGNASHPQGLRVMKVDNIKKIKLKFLLG
jgi:hypothetical protein